MIVSDKDGRHRSHKTVTERRKALKEQWDNLGADEKRLVLSMFDEWDHVATQGEVGFEDLAEIVSMSPVFHQVIDDHYEGTLVSPDDFYFDDYYLGGSGKSLFPTWREDLRELDAGHYNEVIITGSIGGGKTFFCNFGLVREFYKLCMLREPQQTFGLAESSDIVLVCFNRDKKLARDVTFAGVKNLIAASPFFQSLGLKIGTSELVYPKKNIKIIAASVRSSDALGRNVYGGIVDETDFLQGSALVGDGLAAPGAKSFAEQLHDSVMGRMKSRYVRAGALPGKLFMSSSARHKSSFTNKRISACRNDPNVFVRDYAIYQAKPADQFMKEKFWVLVGNERIKHRILTDEEYASFDEEDKQELKEKGCRFLHVPMDFRSDFESNIEKSVQDIGGVVTPSMTRFIQLSERIYEAVDPTLFHPMATKDWNTGERPRMDWSKLSIRRRQKIAPGRYEDVIEPIRHPHAPRHVHIDLSKGASDPAGLCIAHTVDMLEVERRTQEGQAIREEAPLMEVDLLLQILPPRDGEIDFGAIRALVYDFIDHGYSIQFASLDSWQSADSIQKFKQQGIKSEVVSTWKTTEPYDALKTAIYEGRISYYNYPVVIEELEQLEKDETRQKIDHPSGGSKDVADALAGVAFTLSTRASGTAHISLGHSEHEREDQDTEWIRKTMEHKGEKPPIKVGDTPSQGGPLILTG